mmetsp:Transcript_28105/g.89844  ORF Transcript_28105/g.89844 Transcript_28105/m.89844 type:complete len:322 (+) Transcript_28105:1338-2303(+)
MRHDLQELRREQLRSRQVREHEAVPAGLLQLLLRAACRRHGHGGAKEHGLQRVEGERLVARHAHVQIRHGDILQGVPRERKQVNDVPHLELRDPALHRLRVLLFAPAALAARLAEKLQPHARILLADLIHSVDEPKLPLAGAVRAAESDDEVRCVTDCLAARDLQPVLDLPDILGRFELLEISGLQDAGAPHRLAQPDEAPEGLEVSAVELGPEGAHRVSDPDDSINLADELGPVLPRAQDGVAVSVPVALGRLGALHDLVLVEHPGDLGVLGADPGKLLHERRPGDGVEQHELRAVLHHEVLHVLPLGDALDDDSDAEVR